MKNTRYSLGLLGYRLGYSSSPRIHSIFSDALKVDVNYDLFEKNEDEIKSFLETAYEEGMDGFNITVPYKNEVFKLLSDTDDTAKLLGAVNTCVRTDKGFKGYNTDLYGLENALSLMKFDVKGKPVVILGAGGAARACIALMIQKKAKDIYIINRSMEHAIKLKDEFEKKTGFSNLHVAFPHEIIESGIRFFCLQSTSLGLKDNDPAPISDEGFFDNMVMAYDLIPTTKATAFQAMCQKKNVPCQNGIAMLVYQAARAFELWTGKTVTEKTVSDTIKDLLA